MKQQLLPRLYRGAVISFVVNLILVLVRVVLAFIPGPAFRPAAGCRTRTKTRSPWS
jgi:hypothetical protein